MEYILNSCCHKFCHNQKEILSRGSIVLEEDLIQCMTTCASEESLCSIPQWRTIFSCTMAILGKLKMFIGSASIYIYLKLQNTESAIRLTYGFIITKAFLVLGKKLP